MKHIKKSLAALLAVLVGIMSLQACVLITHADSFFEYGDFRFSVNRDNTLSLAGYHGSEKTLVLPDRVADRNMKGLYRRAVQPTADAW